MQRSFPVIALILLTTLSPSAKTQNPSESSYELGRMEALSWVLLQLKQDYVDPTRVHPGKMLQKILEYIERESNEVEITPEGDKVKVKVGTAQKTFTVGHPATVWEMNYNLHPIFQFIGDHLEKTSDPKDVEFAAINGLLSTLDPHSNLLPPKLFREMRLKTTGEFGGLGIRITIRKGALTIISPLPDTPAARLGLRAMDQIVRIGDQSTVNMALDEAVNLLRGKPGTEVSIWVKRVGWTEPHKYTITRKTIRVRSITSKLLKNKIGYIQIQDFSRHTGGDLLSNLSKLKRQAHGLKGLIIDLRNNAGGLLKAAVQIADLFLSHGIIVATVAYSEDSTPEHHIQKSRDEQKANEQGTESKLPIVILVNSGSASASEILAGALKNLDRAVLMGEQTFGKGTVQILNDRVPPSVKDACLKLTVAEYLIPGDISIQEVGVTPDIKLLPMLLDKDDLEVFAQPDRFREQDIPEHLKKKKNEISNKPSFEVRYVFNAPKKKDDQEEPPLKEPEFKEDFQIKFASGLLQHVSTPRGSAMLDEGADYIKKVQQREQKKMVKAMKALGIDWSRGLSDGAKASAKFSLAGKGVDEQGRASADKKILMRLSVTNNGTSPFFRLRAESRSKLGLFDRREFIFGKVNPGETKSWDVPIKIPRGIYSRQDEVRFLFFSEGGKPPANLNTKVTVKGLPRPTFAFSWRILDPEGNGDGLLQPGEKAALELTIFNKGKGKAYDAKALLKNDAGKDLFLEAGGGRVQFDEIPVGKSATRAFKFHVPKDTERESLPVQLTIWDADLSTTEVANLTLPLAPDPPSMSKVKTALRVKQSRVVIRGGADVSSPLVAFAKKGAVFKSDRKQGSWYRIMDHDKPVGWIHESKVRKTRLVKAKPSTESLLPFAQYTPPEIQLQPVPLFLPSGDSVEIKGKITDSDYDLRDVAVWVGNDKVYLESSAEMKNPRSAMIDVKVPLKAGPNYITIIARERAKFAAQKALVVTRPGGLDKKAEDED